MSVQQLLDDVLYATLGAARLFPTRMTSVEELRALLASLHPLATNKALIRLGPDGDGGYVIPDDLAGIQACFSPGVSAVSGFELACAMRGMQVFLADRSVDGPATEHDAFRFTKKFIGATSDDDFMTLDHWVASSLPDATGELLLQMDIEGFEYEVLLAASDALLRRCRIIVAEFHYLDQLWSRPYFGVAARAFAKLLQTHACIHIHPNNCCGSVRREGIELPRIMEFTFLRRDRFDHASFQTTFPSPLDRDNTPKRALVLPRCWYRAE